MICVSTNSQKVHIQQSAAVLIIHVYIYMMFMQQWEEISLNETT